MKALVVVLLLALEAAATTAFVTQTTTKRTCCLSTKKQTRTPFVLLEKSSASKPMKSALQAKEVAPDEVPVDKLPFFLDPGTKGGALTLMVVLFVLPVTAYNVAVSNYGVDEITAGRWIGIGFSAVSLSAWVATLLVRIVNKDMTYAKQLKNYENAVLTKRLEELDDDEAQALVEASQDDRF